ncbi:hypothetical protein EGW08_021868 [Elysia chlorotica]|uniref:DDE-1 domain-containing protein n=1 Tax=Elysia chlorotica TaxID=188477 RepID=A0A433SMK7_ELYCH|nr:hypothetical protein EGW08_021868 [Elysia chlorotica]
MRVHKDLFSKTAYKRVCTEFLASHPSLTINKATWPRLLKQTWDSTMREGLLKKAFEATGIYPVDRSRIPDSVFSASDAIRSMVPVVDAEEGDNPEDGAEGETTAATAEAGTGAEHHEDITQEDIAGETEDTNPVVSFDDMEQLQFLNGLMIDITDDDIEQAVDASNLVQRVDALPSPSATSTDTTPSLDAPGTSFSSAAGAWNAEIDAIFDLRPAPSKATAPKRSRAITTHRLLTSQELINEKKARLEKKEKEDAAKRERKGKALQKKLEKTQSQTTHSDTL